MPSIWEAPPAIKNALRELKDDHHTHLSEASIWCLCSDANPIRQNKLVVTQTKKCTKTEKLSSGHDFKVVVLMDAWEMLPDKRRTVALDEALARCGVKFVPDKVEVNGKVEVIKDDFGRVQFTDEIDRDIEGNPKWTLNPPDAEGFGELAQRYGAYTDELEKLIKATKK